MEFQKKSQLSLGESGSRKIALEKIKLSLFADELILYIKNPKDTIKRKKKNYEN